MRGSIDHERARERMVHQQVMARGVRSPEVLTAMRAVRREGYVPSYLGEFAYEDAPLPIEEEQTISQPYIVAFMVEALRLSAEDRVLEIGTGSGYAAAVLAEIAAEVYTIERHPALARQATERLARDGYENVHVRCGDGTLGWPERAPFDGIVVAAGGPSVPDSLREQLAVGGRLVIPVGAEVGLQKLVRITRVTAERYVSEDLADVRFVPLIGAEGWRAEEPPPLAARPVIAPTLRERVRLAAEPFAAHGEPDLEPLLARIGDARVVLLGESTHGTAEFYRLRARITQALVERAGFTIVAAEADWADAARVDRYVRRLQGPVSEWQAFARFPTWMWRNREFRAFVDWLHDHNANVPTARRVRFAGLDLYGLYTSIAAVLEYLDRVDPQVAHLARERYGCLTPWQHDPTAYGRAALSGAYRSCEEDVVRVLHDLFRRRGEFARVGDEQAFDAVQNARVAADAETYYRAVYYGAHESWNLRDRHMFGTLRDLLAFHGPHAKAVVWEHNSHVGDASATDMAARGELNVGQLCRREHGDAAYSIGFGTDHGTVAAASHWDGPMEVKDVRPAHERSYERLFHETGIEQFLLPLRAQHAREVRRDLTPPRLERAIGVLYRPETELASHYFHAVLPYQFDEFVWVDETHAVHPIATQELAGVGATYPFGL